MSAITFSFNKTTTEIIKEIKQIVAQLLDNKTKPNQKI